eukprot:CAMPEP_0194052248 /NCGR_PEP_ID=MMETSP0009_2-20130614/44637_1 /TAXON_ID=210454 /ORGANISM="Grammatophora oceanica, Strain CCMP 410" /LENGTH=799 /DNA_ID=CAMNT_0038699751 /DNA_START=137 /DNA_END=2535 /DNA_ORIENTATION=+
MNEEDWSIGVRRLGGEDDFTVKVSPEDDLNVLQDIIAEKTGLRVAEQRLIYRGRLIGGSQASQPRPSSPGLSKNGAKVKDVIGLGDGHTIHLVPKPMESGGSEDARPPPLSTATSSTEASTLGSSPNEGSSGSSGSTTGLLAALLGLAGDGNNDSPSDPISQQLQRLRSARLARNRSRRAAYRLTEADLAVPNPGATEGVRQGLMTMHTLLPELQATSDTTWTRQWYRGQWVDCLDTVNQWLEATVVDIVRPEDVLPRQLRDFPRNRRRRVVHPTTDEIVTANDFEGRMRLLLETCDDYDAEGEWGGYRQRENNDGVQLLLIHYNGWPHRWDEWMRSDSERIRPFRTRTRHATGSSASLPSPQSVYSNAPTTIVADVNEEVERGALLPELRRVLSVVNDTFAKSVPDRETSETGDEDLPWLKTGSNGAVLEDHTDDVAATPNENISYNRRDLESLAPLMDRLGRLLQDAAPHVASYAATLPKNESPEPQRTPPGESNVIVPQETEMDAVATTIGIGSFSASNSEHFVVRPDGDSELPLVEDDEPILQNPDYSDFTGGVINTARGEARSRARGGNDEGASLLGTYLAAAGLESLGSNRAAASGGGDDEEEESGSGLQSLSRAIRQRENNNGGGNGGGIDIHIHAIVSPGIGPGFGGMTMIGEPQVTPRGTTPTQTTFETPTSELPPAEEPPQAIDTIEDPDDQGIFADLYSDDVDALDLHAATEEFPTAPLPEVTTASLATNSAPCSAPAIVSESRVVAETSDAAACFCTELPCHFPFLAVTQTNATVGAELAHRQNTVL